MDVHVNGPPFEEARLKNLKRFAEDINHLRLDSRLGVMSPMAICTSKNMASDWKRQPPSLLCSHKKLSDYRIYIKLVPSDSSVNL